MNKQYPTEDLVFPLPLDFSEELPERFTSTSIIGGKCSSVWDCGDQVSSVCPVQSAILVPRDSYQRDIII